MDAILAAGGVPQEGEPLYEFTQGGYKSLVDVAGKPMVQWVLDAISGTANIDRVVLVGLDESSGLSCRKALTFLPDQGGMIDNIRAATRRVQELNTAAEYVLMVFSDIPLITSEMLNWVVESSQEARYEVYLSMVTRDAMNARFPGLKRRFTRLNDIELRPGDINVVTVDKVMETNGLGDRISEARHSLLRQIALIGLDTLFFIFFRRFDLADFVQHMTKKMGIIWQPLICPYPEIAMDVDDPRHLEIVRAELSKRSTP